MNPIASTLITIATVMLYLMALSANRRAQRAEAALARVEAVIADRNRSVRYYHVRNAINDGGAA